MMRWGCGTPNCDAGFRVHLHQTWRRVQCRLLGHKWQMLAISHIRSNGDIVVTGYRHRCDRCYIDKKDTK